MKSCYGKHSIFVTRCNYCETKLDCAGIKVKKKNLNKKVDDILKRKCYGFHDTRCDKCIKCETNDNCVLETIRNGNLNKPQVSLLTGHYIPKPIDESKDIKKIVIQSDYKINVKLFFLSEENKVNEFLNNLDPEDVNDIKIDSGFYVIIYKKRG